MGKEVTYAETWNRTIGAWPVGQGVGSADIRNRQTPARFTPTGLPLGRQSRCRLAPSHPLKAKVDGWSRKLWQAAGIGWADVTALSKTVRHQPFQRHVTAPSVTGEHASETEKPQQDSGPTGCHLVGRTATWTAEPLQFSTFEPPKSKGGWVRQKALIDWQAGEHASETAKRQQDSGPPSCHLVGRAAAVWHLRTR